MMLRTAIPAVLATGATLALVNVNVPTDGSPDDLVSVKSASEGRGTSTLGTASARVARWPRDDRSIDRQPDCRVERCEISLEPLVTLSDSASPGLFGDRIFVERDGLGRWITSTIAFDRLAVFGPSGDFERVIGRDGEGPMEFRRAMPPFRAPAGDGRGEDQATDSAASSVVRNSMCAFICRFSSRWYD